MQICPSFDSPDEVVGKGMRYDDAGVGCRNSGDVLTNEAQQHAPGTEKESDRGATLKCLDLILIVVILTSWVIIYTQQLEIQMTAQHLKDLRAIGDNQLHRRYNKAKEGRRLCIGFY